MAYSLMTSQNPPEPAQGHEAHGAFDAIKHRSHEMKWIPARAYRYASKDMPVLITGETGAGKELIAKAIHAAGPLREDLSSLGKRPGSIIGHPRHRSHQTRLQEALTRGAFRVDLY